MRERKTPLNKKKSPKYRQGSQEIPPKAQDKKGNKTMTMKELLTAVVEGTVVTAEMAEKAQAEADALIEELKARAGDKFSEAVGLVKEIISR